MKYKKFCHVEDDLGLEPYEVLVVAVIKRALWDTEQKNQEKANEALIWLLDGGASLAELAGIDQWNYRKRLQSYYSHMV